MKYFKREEFACQCGCRFDTVDYELANVLEDVREFFGKPVIVNSGCRCIEHNETVQKKANKNYVPYSSKSIHMEGKAADIRVKDTHEDLVANYLEEKYPGKYGIGRYNGRTHIDTRSNGPARWDYR